MVSATSVVGFRFCPSIPGLRLSFPLVLFSSFRNFNPLPFSLSGCRGFFHLLVFVFRLHFWMKIVVCGLVLWKGGSVKSGKRKKRRKENDKHARRGTN